MKYQVLPDLSAEELAALRDDIREHGIRIPIEVDESGEVIDGHHRKRIAEELGIQCPKRVRQYPDEEAKRRAAWNLNLHRRHLDRETRRLLIEQSLREDPTRSDREIANDIGVNHETVGARRKHLEDGGEIRHQPTRVGKDGVAQPAARSRRKTPCRQVSQEETPPSDGLSVDLAERVRARSATPVGALVAERHDLSLVQRNEILDLVDAISSICRLRITSDGFWDVLADDDRVAAMFLGSLKGARTIIEDLVLRAPGERSRQQ